MTPDDVRAAAEQLVQFHERFAPLFGKEQAQDHAYDLPQGADDLPRAQEHRADRAVRRHTARSPGSQKFVGIAPWQYDDVQAEVQSVFADELVPSAAGTPVGSSGSSTRVPSPRRGRTPPAWPGNTTAGSARRTTARSASSWSA